MNCSGFISSSFSCFLFLYLIQYLCHRLQTLLKVFGYQCGHRSWRACTGIIVEGFIITASVSKLHIDGRIAGLDELEVHQQTARTAITVDKWSIALEGIAVVGVLNDKLLSQSLGLSWREGTKTGEIGFQLSCC